MNYFQFSEQSEKTSTARLTSSERKARPRPVAFWMCSNKNASYTPTHLTLRFSATIW